MNDSELTMKARAIARCLSYNDDENQAAAKHILRELAHRLDVRDVRVHKSRRGGFVLINGIGATRRATFKERALYRLFGVIPRRV